MSDAFRVGLAALCLACAPSLTTIKGVPAPSRVMPALQLAGGHRRVVFRWEYSEGEMLTRGEGAVRIAAPDSARLDFFIGGFGGGAAAIIGDSLRAHGGGMAKRFIPPVPMMWAALGRFAIPALQDTTVYEDGDLLRADVGRPAEWRVAARGDTLLSLAHIPGGRISEQLSRTTSGEVVYEVPSAHRKLRLTILRSEETDPFDASIWNP